VNNLQAQREGESDRQHFAYKCYKDLGEGRTILAAYRIYLKSSTRKNISNSQKIPASASPDFKRWASMFDWEGRVKDWDSQKAERIQASLLEADRDSYIQRIEDSRALLEETAMMGMNAAKTGLEIAIAQLEELLKESEDGILSKERIDRFLAVSRAAGVAIDTLGNSKTQLYDALGLVKTIEDLATINHC
jgi:hypothetical protein